MRKVPSRLSTTPLQNKGGWVNAPVSWWSHGSWPLAWERYNSQLTKLLTWLLVPRVLQGGQADSEPFYIVAFIVHIFAPYCTAPTLSVSPAPAPTLTPRPMSSLCSWELPASYWLPAAAPPSHWWRGRGRVAGNGLSRKKMDTRPLLHMVSDQHVIFGPLQPILFCITEPL